MERETKEKATIGVAVGASAAAIGWVQGASLDHLVAEKIGNAISTGDLKSLAAYIGIFLLIWIQVKGLRKEVRAFRLALSAPEGTVSKSFAKGDLRMNAIEEKHAADFRLTEGQILDHEHRLTLLEKITTLGGENERTSLI